MTTGKPEILIIENDSNYQQFYRKILKQHFRVHLTTIHESWEALNRGDIIAVVANCRTRRGERLAMDGFSLIRRARSQGSLVPFIFLVDAIDDYILWEADQNGAFEVIRKGTPDFSLRLLRSLQIAADFFKYKLKWHGQRHRAIGEVLYNLPHLSPIVWNNRDEHLYDAFFEIDSRSNKFCYANSWAYICQAARRNGHKFFDGKTLITIEASEKNNGAYEFEIIRPLGQQATRKAFELATALKTLTTRPIIFKRLEDEQFKSLQQRGCQVLEKPASGRLEDYFDDIHPQVVVDLNKFIFNINMPEMAWFRRGLRQFTRRNYTIKDLKPSQYQDVRTVLARWKRSFVSRYEKKSDFTVIPLEDDYYFDPYLPFVEYFGRVSKRNQNIASIFYLDQVPVGFSFLVRVSESCMAMYANVADTYFDGLSYFMLYQNFFRALWAGYSFVNLGGTESKSLYDFYCRLLGEARETPSKELYLSSLDELTIKDLTRTIDVLREQIRKSKIKTGGLIDDKKLEEELSNVGMIKLFNVLAGKESKVTVREISNDDHQIISKNNLIF